MKWQFELCLLLITEHISTQMPHKIHHTKQLLARVCNLWLLFLVNIVEYDFSLMTVFSESTCWRSFLQKIFRFATWTGATHLSSEVCLWKWYWHGFFIQLKSCSTVSAWCECHLPSFAEYEFLAVDMFVVQFLQILSICDIWNQFLVFDVFVVRFLEILFFCEVYIQYPAFVLFVIQFLEIFSISDTLHFFPASFIFLLQFLSFFE